MGKSIIADKDLPKNTKKHKHDWIPTAHDGGYSSKFTGEWLAPITRWYCTKCKKIRWVYD